MICEWQIQVDVRKLGRNLPKELMICSRRVSVTTTSCNYGGVRYWFQCPGCDRRCAILYPNICRICSGGRYELEAQNSHDRKITRVIKLRHRLGQTSGGTVAKFPRKPKWMRWHTYLQLRAKSEGLEKLMWQEAAKKMR